MLAVINRRNPVDRQVDSKRLQNEGVDMPSQQWLIVQRNGGRPNKSRYQFTGALEKVTVVRPLSRVSECHSHFATPSSAADSLRVIRRSRGKISKNDSVQVVETDA